MECYSVHIPVGTKISGTTADGCAAQVLAGEYLVHRILPKLPTRVSPVLLLRFVGADPAGRDVHVRLDALRGLPSALGVTALRVQDAAEFHEAA